MSLNVPDVGENVALENFVNKTAPQDQSLRLFKNNLTPSDTDVAATNTVATFPGYANIALTGANWNAAASGSIAYNAQQTFTCSGVAIDDIYGYWLQQTTSTILMWNERDGAAPFAVRNNGDTVKVTPTITAN
jgi:hypothetical protein